MNRRRPAGLATAVPSAAQRLTGPSVVLFLAMFAGQAALLVLSPILPDMARDLGVSTSVAAQLRSLSGACAGLVALWVGLRSRPRPLRDLIGAGLALLTAGSVVSAAAPDFAVLAAAQLALGVGLGLVLSGALAAAGVWAPQARAATLSWALAGQPVAWVVGMPVAGVVAEASWRYAWLAVPALSGALALLMLSRRPRDQATAAASDEPSLWSYAGSHAWAGGELLAYGGWAGILIFIGALLIDSYQTPTTVVGVVLALAAAAYVPGNFLARRWAERQATTVLAMGGALCAAGALALGGMRPGLLFSSALLALLAFVAGGRTLAGSSRGLSIAPGCPLQAMSVRTAAVQFGYLLGAALGGVALARGGYPALGATLSAMLAGSSLLHLWSARLARRSPTTAATRP